MCVCVCVCINTFKENTCVLPKAFGAEGTLRLYQPLQSPFNPSCVECVCFEVCARFCGFVRIRARVCVFVRMLKRVEVDLKAKHAVVTRPN